MVHVIQELKIPSNIKISLTMKDIYIILNHITYRSEQKNISVHHDIYFHCGICIQIILLITSESYDKVKYSL